MTSDPRGGIVRSGASGNYVYNVKQNVSPSGVVSEPNYSYANKPVVFVNWLSAARFTNWLNNGQGSSDTETGAYTMANFPSESQGRNVGAKWFLPTEDEWYKAAFYDPSSGGFYDYETGTNVPPDNHATTSDSGNSANYATANGSGAYPLTGAGAYTQSASPFGTFDQAGNVWEWTESEYLDVGRVLARTLRGGYFSGTTTMMRANNRFGRFGPSAGLDVGFRVATIGVPEPSTFILSIAGLVTLGTRRRKSVPHNRV
jgi:formylglycine-generating enzyme required for sulfatase activity